MLLQLSHFFLPFIPLRAAHPLPPSFPQLTSCSWVIHVSFLASPFPILFLTSPCLFSTYHLCYLFPVPLPSFSPLPLPSDNPPCNLHFCDSVPVLVVCLVFLFVLFFFLVQLLVIVSFFSFYCSQFLIFYFLDKSL